MCVKLSDLPTEIFFNIFSNLPKEDIFNLSTVDSYSHELTYGLLTKRIHIVLIPTRSNVRDARVSIQDYYTYAAPPDLYFKGNKLPYGEMKNIVRVFKVEKVRELISRIMNDELFASNINSLTIEMLSLEEQYLRNADDVYSNDAYFDESIVSQLSHSTFYSKLVNCRHLSLPVELIPLDKDTSYFERKILQSFTLNMTNIKHLTFYKDYDVRNFLDAFTENDYTGYDVEAGEHIDYDLGYLDLMILEKENEDANRRKAFTKSVNDSLSLSSSKDESFTEKQFNLIVSYSKRFSRFLKIVSNNDNIKTIYFNGLDHIHKYTSLLEEENYLNLNRYFNVDIGDCLDSVKKFATKLVSEDGFDEVYINSTETKISNPDQLSIQNFLWYFLKLLPGNKQQMRCKNLYLHYSRDEFKRLEDASVIIDGGSSKFIYDNESRPLFRFIDVDYVDKFHLSWRNYGSCFLRQSTTFETTPKKNSPNKYEDGLFSKACKIHAMPSYNMFIGRPYEEGIHQMLHCNEDWKSNRRYRSRDGVMVFPREGSNVFEPTSSNTSYFLLAFE